MGFRLSVCAPMEQAPAILRAGGAFVEPAFLQIAGMTPEVFRERKAILQAAGLKAEAMNSMLPGDSVLYGGPADTKKLLDFTARGMERAAELGGDVVVFGSGTARRIPDGMTREQAEERITQLLGQFCEIAAPYGMRIAVEPLRATETNFIHTLIDALAIIRRLPECRNLGVNADLFHMLEGNETFSDCSLVGDKLFHVHVCTPERTYPRPGNAAHDETYRAFAEALRNADYHGTVSVEGITHDLAGEMPPALRHLRTIF